MALRHHPADTFTKQALHILEKEYVVLGSTRIRSLHAWVIIIFLAGFVAAVALLASRSGTLATSEAALVASGTELCKISDFHRRKVLDEVSQAHERVKNTYTDTSAKFNAAESKFNSRLNLASGYLNANIISTAQAHFDEATNALREMRLWAVQASFDTTDVDDWGKMAAAIRNTCGAGLPGSNAADKTKLQEAFGWSKNISVRYVQALKAYVDLYSLANGKLTIKSGIKYTDAQAGVSSEWLESSAPATNALLTSYGITNFTNYLSTLNGLTVSVARPSRNDVLSRYIGISEALAQAESISVLEGLTSTNPYTLAAFTIAKHLFFNLIDFSMFGSAVEADKESMINASNEILKKAGFTFQLKPMKYQAVLNTLQVMSNDPSNFNALVKYKQACLYATPFILNWDHSLPEESFTRFFRQVCLQLTLTCHEQDSSKSVQQCVDFGYTVMTKFVSAVPNYDGPRFEKEQQSCKALGAGGVVGDACHPPLSVEQ
ncbi:MAG: hypothetical protein G01um101470_554 [Parcubacteria group bacterium Gr01-1014_70]|nr:MAG: hypothetical protein G01um101470_554 [Parcubacteria group bacterium Gr01-1014_70]